MSFITQFTGAASSVRPFFENLWEKAKRVTELGATTNAESLWKWVPGTQTTGGGSWWSNMFTEGESGDATTESWWRKVANLAKFGGTTTSFSEHANSLTNWVAGRTTQTTGGGSWWSKIFKFGEPADATTEAWWRKVLNPVKENAKSLWDSVAGPRTERTGGGSWWRNIFTRKEGENAATESWWTMILKRRRSLPIDTRVLLPFALAVFGATTTSHFEIPGKFGPIVPTFAEYKVWNILNNTAIVGTVLVLIAQVTTLTTTTDEPRYVIIREIGNWILFITSSIAIIGFASLYVAITRYNGSHTDKIIAKVILVFFCCVLGFILIFKLRNCVRSCK